MKAANDNDPLPFVQIAATLANVMTYLSLKQNGDQNAKDACHNSLLGAHRSVVNPSGRCNGTS
jgi:hypothetical protein